LDSFRSTRFQGSIKSENGCKMLKTDRSYQKNGYDQSHLSINKDKLQCFSINREQVDYQIVPANSYALEA